MKAAAIGPIPAHAGEPAVDSYLRRRGWAYPRSRGGTARNIISLEDELGLSPLTRGNRAQDVVCPPAQGPIPAHAGEPAPGAAEVQATGAYPRSRGGTAGSFYPPLPPWGLSPLTRGNPSAQSRTFCPSGPIPAHAGEPQIVNPCSSLMRAYPRSRGGTVNNSFCISLYCGLSPLTRGNQLRTFAC